MLFAACSQAPEADDLVLLAEPRQVNKKRSTRLALRCGCSSKATRLKHGRAKGAYGTVTHG